MPFSRPTLDTIKARTSSAIRAALGIGPFLRRSVLGAISETVALTSHSLHGRLDSVSLQMFPQTASGADLDTWGFAVGGRKPAAFARGTVVFTGTNGTTIPEGTKVQRGDALTFGTLADGTISGGSVEIEVRATVSGTTGNTTAGTSLALLSAVTNVDADATVGASGITDGADLETDDAYRARIVDNWANPPFGGNAADYRRWALEVPGVDRAWAFPQWNGAVDAVGIAFSVLGDVYPSSQKVAEVQAYIDERRPITAVAVVVQLQLQLLNFQIALSPNTIAVQNAVEAELEALIQAEAAPGGTLLLSRLNEAISRAPGEVDHVLIAPDADVASTNTQLVSLGSITWSAI